MNVAELIEALKECPQDAKVLMSRDPEGNGYHWLAGFDEGTMPPTEINDGYIDSYYSDSHSDDDCCLKPGARDNFKKVICLWP